MRSFNILALCLLLEPCAALSTAPALRPAVQAATCSRSSLTAPSRCAPVKMAQSDDAALVDRAFAAAVYLFPFSALNQL